MATRGNLKKTNISVLRNIASDLGINSKKKKKDDLICDILSSQAPEVSLTPVDQSISAVDGAGAGAVVQFKENLPPFNAVHSEPISHNTQLSKVSFTSVYEFMITRRRHGDQSIQNFKGLDKSVKHFDAGDVQDICLAQWNVPRTMNKKPMPISTLNLSRPKVVASSETDVNVAMLSSPSHGSAMARFDPRHSEDRHHSLTWSLDQLRKLEASFPLTGMAHLWNILDTCVPSVVENEVEVTTAVHPLHLKMEMMVFSDGNLPPPMIDQELVSYIEKHTRAQILSDLWKKLHLGRITSSIIGDVLQSGDKPTSLIQQILYGSNLDKYSKLPLAVQWGVDHEMDAKEVYLQIRRAIQMETDVQESGLTLCSTHSFLGASSDGRVVDNESTGLLEIKCPYSISGQNGTLLGISDIMSMNSKQFCLEVGELGPTLKKSHKYYAQVQGEMAIIGLPLVDFVVWTAANFFPSTSGYIIQVGQPTTDLKNLCDEVDHSKKNRSFQDVIILHSPNAPLNMNTELGNLLGLKNFISAKLARSA
uniref:YqaJ viral recombinase domain-containing protein n=1 Tax=Magallana gigas TaxID=29159 RepID=A0A8W8NR40_MAGGI